MYIALLLDSFDKKYVMSSEIFLIIVYVLVHIKEIIKTR